MKKYKECLMYILNKLDYLLSEQHKEDTIKYLKKEFGENSFSANNPEPYILGEIKGEMLWTSYMLTDDISVLRIK